MGPLDPPMGGIQTFSLLLGVGAALLKEFGVDIRQVYARHAMRSNASIQKHSDLWSNSKKQPTSVWRAVDSIDSGSFLI